MEEKGFFYKLSRNISKVFLNIWYHPKYEGLENIPTTGGIVLAGNHRTMKDPLLVAYSTKRIVHYLAKDKYAEKKGISWFFKATKCITVYSKKDNNKEAMHDAIEVLNKGLVIGIFPEGTRNKTKEPLLPFKFGAVSMASKTNSLVVPFGIKGDFKFHSKNLVIRFGKPFKVSPDDLETANKKLFNEVKKLITKE